MTKYRLTLLALFALATAPLFAEPSVLELRGKPEGAKPDILFLAPRLTENPKAYQKVLEPAAELGTRLPRGYLSFEDFCASGPLPILDAAGYRLLPIREVAWGEACQRLAEILELRQKSRTEDGIRQPPLCAILSEEATPDELGATLPALLESDALIFLAPQMESLPLTVIWKNNVWPAHTSNLPVLLDHWVPTLTEIVGLPVPADCAAASALPLLTGVGYQRPLDYAPSAAQPAEPNTIPYTEVRLYTNLPKNCPWVPDFTDLFPTERAFLRATPPLPTEELRGLKKSDTERGLYIRTALKEYTLVLPAGVSCVVREKGRPVFSRWKTIEPITWNFLRTQTVPLEFFFVIPANFDPATLLIFQQPTPVVEPETAEPTPAPAPQPAATPAPLERPLPSMGAPSKPIEPEPAPEPAPAPEAEPAPQPQQPAQIPAPALPVAPPPPEA